MVRPSGKVLTVDPGSLDYGAPCTLGQAQGQLSRSELDSSIRWIQQYPVEYLEEGRREAEYVVLERSLLCLPSENYLHRLLTALASAIAADEGRKPTLLLAEWGMRTSTPAAAAHLLAVKAQMVFPIPDGNTRNKLTPGRVTTLANEAGWCLDTEVWLRRPGVEDGKWEVAVTRALLQQDDVPSEAGSLIEAMDTQAQAQEGVVESMDVWTCVFKQSSFDQAY